MLPLPKKVAEKDSRDLMVADVYTYDASMHEAIRLMLLEAKAFLENKKKTTRIVVDGYLLTISPQQSRDEPSARINEIITTATRPS